MKTSPLTLQPRFRRTGAQIMRTAVFLGSVLLVVSVFLFTHQTIRRLSSEVSRMAMTGWPRRASSS